MKHKETRVNAKPARQAGGWQKVFDGRNHQVRGLWRRGPSYYAQIKVFDPDKGGRVPKRIRLEKATTVPQAVKALSELKLNRDKNRVAAKAAPRLAEYLTARLKAEEKTSAPSTVSGRKSMAKNLIKKLGDLRLTDILPMHIRNYRESRLESATASTINLEVGLLSTTLNKALEDGIIIENRIGALKRMRENRKRKKLFTSTEIKAVADACLKHLPVAGQSYHDLILLMAYSGCRISEALNLKWDSAVRWNERKLVLGETFTTKGKEVKSVDFYPPLEAHLKDMQTRIVPDSKYMFPSPRRSEKPGGDARITGTSTAMASIREHLPEDFTPHCCRVYFISHCVMAGIDFMTIARWVGHKDGGVLIGKVYGHLSPGHAAQQAQRITFEPVVLRKDVA